MIIILLPIMVTFVLKKLSTHLKCNIMKSRKIINLHHVVINICQHRLSRELLVSFPGLCLYHTTKIRRWKERRSASIPPLLRLLIFHFISFHASYHNLFVCLSVCSIHFWRMVFIQSSYQIIHARIKIKDFCSKLLPRKTF